MRLVLPGEGQAGKASLEIDVQWDWEAEPELALSAPEKTSAGMSTGLSTEENLNDRRSSLVKGRMRHVV